jgi:hypothetical protein
VIGAIFLAIVLLSPGGLMGIWQSITNFLERQLSGGPPTRPGPADEARPASNSPQAS